MGGLCRGERSGRARFRFDHHDTVIPRAYQVVRNHVARLEEVIVQSITITAHPHLGRNIIIAIHAQHLTAYPGLMLLTRARRIRHEAMVEMPEPRSGTRSNDLDWVPSCWTSSRA